MPIPRAARPSPSPFRVLIVDDDPAVVLFLVRALEMLGENDVVVARNGAEALKIETGRNGGVDLIICDLQMPELDGIEYLRHLTDRGYSGAILLASGAGPRILRAAEGLGRSRDLAIAGVLEKPIRLDDLARALERARDGRGRPPSAADVAVSEAELEAALEAGQLFVEFQPQADARSLRPVGAEALIRWEHPEKGRVPPVLFVPLAEECGLIDPLTDLVLGEALDAACAWRAAGFDLTVSLNLSARNLHRLAFPERVAARLAEAGLPPEKLVLELTESAIEADPAAMLEILTRLRLKGIGLSVDDFGTGWAMLERLRRIPFTELKLDRGFVTSATDDPTSRAIVESSVFLAHRLGITAVAEGVESDAEWGLVRELGVDVIQGWRVERPMPGEAFARWLESSAVGA